MNEPVSLGAETLPEQEICREALLEKYAKGKERTVAEVRARVARALAAVEAPTSALTGSGASSKPRKPASSPPGASTPRQASSCRRR